MSSSVFFKFKSQKEPTRVEFDGTGISVFELKREVIIRSGLGDGTDFDLALYSEDASEEYDDDTTIIPRSTTVVARRLPASKPGAGRAARYVSGRMPASAKNASRREQTAKSAPSRLSDALAQMNSAMTEEERMTAMFQAQSEQLQTQQDEFSHARGPGGRPPFKKSNHIPDHEPPKGYVCHRCNKPGHWIQACPTNNDTEFDNRHRFKPTTGIPRSFLKTVNASEIAVDGERPAGIMKQGDQYFVAEPDRAAWQQFQAKAAKSNGGGQDTDTAREVKERGLACPVDERMFIDPMKTPCCQKTYCNDCITNALIESDFVCPGCQQDGVLLDDLKADEEATKNIKLYLEEKEARMAAAAAAADAAKSPSPNADEKNGEESAKEKSSAPSPSPSQKSKTKSPAAEPMKQAGSQDGGTVKAVVSKFEGPLTKKRPADDILDNPRIPKAPKAMQQKADAEAAAAAAAAAATAAAVAMQQNMMNGFSSMMPIMPFGNMSNIGSSMHNMNNMNNMSNMNNMNNMNNMGNINNMNNMNNMSSNTGNMGNMMSGFPVGAMSAMPMNMGINPMMGMMYPMMGMPGFNLNGGGPPNNNINNRLPGGGGQAGSYRAEMMNGGSGCGSGGGITSQRGGGYPNGGGYNPTRPVGGGDDDAYFRKPVNPYRHQNRQKRVRPSDYREL